MATKEIIEKIFNKSFIKFKDDPSICENTIILLNHFILAQCSEIRNDLLRNFYNTYSNILNEDNFSSTRSLRAKTSVIWGLYLMLSNFDLSEFNILELKQMMLKKSLDELKENVEKTTIKDALSCNLMKVIMLVLSKFLYQGIEEKCFSSYFDEERIITIAKIIIFIFDKYMPFEYLVQFSMSYNVGELAKLSLEVTTIIFSLSDQFTDLILSKISKEKFSALIANSFKYIQDSFRYSDIIQKFFDFLAILFRNKSENVQSILQMLVDKGIKHFEFTSNKVYHAEVVLCSNFYKNYPLSITRKMIYENYVIKVITGGFESDEFKIKIAVINLIKNMLERYHKEGRVEYIKEKLNKKNIFSIAENYLITPNKEFNQSILDLYNYIGSIQVDSDSN